MSKYGKPHLLIGLTESVWKGRNYMSVTKNSNIKKIDEKISQLQARKKALENKEKQKAKKERTQLLIQYGEIVEKHLKCKTPEELEAYFIKQNTIEEAKNNIAIPFNPFES